MVAWLKHDHGLGRGHAMAVHGVLKYGATHAGGGGSHTDPSTELRLDGVANR